MFWSLYPEAEASLDYSPDQWVTDVQLLQLLAPFHLHMSRLPQSSFEVLCVRNAVHHVLIIIHIIIITGISRSNLVNLKAIILNRILNECRES